MALPLSGPISLLDIQAEFGGPTPINLENYYKNGQYVTQYSYSPNVPEEGPISLSDFYGAYSYQPVAHTVTLTDGESFTVPSTIVGPLTLTLTSSSGGNGGNDVGRGYPGYPGHRVTGNITVSIGDVLFASIGGAGGAGGSGSGSGFAGAAGAGGTLGYSGGRGGNPGYSGWSGGGGGGGGATVVTQNGTPVIVAGGGAGGGGGGWHSNGRPTQGYISTGSIVGGNGQDKGGGDGGGSGGGGGGQLGGIGGPLVSGDEGAWSGDDGADLIPPGGSSAQTSANPTVILQGVW